jgi:hypothetical protein
VLACAQGDEPPHERLRFAYQDALRQVQPHDVPEDLRDDLAALKARLARLDTPDEQGLGAEAPQRVSAEEASEMIATLVEMFDKIARAVGRWQD